jgi:serine/threonine protein phosphatase PrpC
MAFQLQLRAFLGTSTGTVRLFNEDAGHIHLSSLDRQPTSALLVVADGFQGKDGKNGTGRAASELVVNAIGEELRTFIELPEPESNVSSTRLVEQLVSAIARANSALCIHHGKRGLVSGLACVLTQNNDAAIVNNADCRVYRLRNDELHMITNNRAWWPASKRSLESWYGAMIGTELAVQPNRWPPGHRMDTEFARKANSPAAVQLNLWTESLEVGDRLLLGSDGLWGPLYDEKIALCLRESDSPELAVQRLIDAASEGGGPDNITAIVCDVVSKQPV